MIQYASNPDTPGFILMPSDTGTESLRFRPDGYFLLFVSGTITHPLTVWGIPTVLIDEANANDYWSELQPGFELTDQCKAAGFECLPGLTVELRQGAANVAFIQWGYGLHASWGATRGGLS